MNIKNGLIGTCSAALFLSALAYFNAGSLRTSDTGVMLILGYESCRLDPYHCQAKVWTDGVGNTFDVVPNQRITETHAARDFVHNLKHFEKGLSSMIDVNVSQNVWDSLVSFSYNVGLGAFQDSTLLKKLNKGDTTGAGKELTRWVYSDGKILNGLMARRQAETELCLGLDFSGPIAEFEKQLAEHHQIAGKQ